MRRIVIICKWCHHMREIVTMQEIITICERSSLYVRDRYHMRTIVTICERSLPYARDRHYVREIVTICERSSPYARDRHHMWGIVTICEWTKYDIFIYKGRIKYFGYRDNEAVTSRKNETLHKPKTSPQEILIELIFNSFITSVATW